MNFTLITCSKQSSEEIHTMSIDYIKRIKRFAQFTHVNIKPSSLGQTAKRRTEDTQKILTKIPKQALVICCDEHGKSYSSKAFSQMVSESFLQMPHLCFLIGPALGFDQALINQYNKVKLSDMTLQHEHVQLLLLEQIYRALTLLHNHPYHVN